MQNKNSNKRKKGFTLAEVLLTMTIIGIIAALTIPSLITSTSKSETEAKLQKFYAMMSQAVELAETEYDTDIISIIKTNGIKEFLESYLKGSYSDDEFYFNDGTKIDISNTTIYTYTGDNSQIRGLAFCPNANECSTIGVDKFNFYFSNKDGFITGISSYTCDDDDSLAKYCEIYSSSTMATGDMGVCTLLIQCNGWKIPDNYPLDI